MSIPKLKQAIKSARNSLEKQLPAFFILPKDADEFARTVALEPDLKSEMVTIAIAALEHAEEYEQVEYDPDHRIIRGEEVLLVSEDRVNDESELFDIIDGLDGLEDLHAKLLVDTPTRMYGLAFGATAEERILFVRRKRMDTITADGRLFAIAGSALRAVNQPGVLLDRFFDLIIFPEGIVAFNSETFERLLKDPQDVSAELRKNATAVAKSVPFAPGLLDKLVARGEKKPMIRRKLRSIVERKHLVGVTIPEIKTALKNQGKSASTFIKKDPNDKAEKLDFSMDDAIFILGFLDEGTWRGWRSNTHYTAGGRSIVK